MKEKIIIAILILIAIILIIISVNMIVSDYHKPHRFPDTNYKSKDALFYYIASTNSKWNGYLNITIWVINDQHTHTNIRTFNFGELSKYAHSTNRRIRKLANLLFMKSTEIIASNYRR